ncbi:MAG: 50S ribosomal protein L20 [Bacteroidales bacterium]|jgi:large subunit ribosomal protein L20|nr:50S ribosomal protein L20 [Bacteroidales bacterium]MDD4067854.1 50S ribosomal protein L20 [Bacteroidales bacterium]MDD4739443.1 50S ribosomal protein L20 [Bacteroidales bacterium]MDX9799360.1 50S ribosomal protein L20 [Bacteroidales bacterium]
MPRSVNAVASRARRKKILKRTKGFWGRGKNVWTVAKNKWEKGQQYAYRDRKNKKREFRALWINRINAACRQNEVSYSVFMGLLHKNNIELNRKVLADLAMNHPEAFAAVVKQVKK